MRAMGLLIKRDLRKRPGQAISMLLLALIAGVLANVGLLLATDYAHNLAAKQAAWNAPQAVVLVGHLPGWETVVSDLTRDSAVRQVEAQPGWLARVTLAYGGNDLSTLAFVYDADSPVDLGRRTITSRTEVPLDRPVWVPAAFGASGNYALGDPITLTTATGAVRFHIQAFVEDTYTGTPGFGLLAFGLPGKGFADFTDSSFAPATMVKVAAADIPAATDAIGRATKQSFPVASYWDLNGDLLTAGAAMSAGIFSTVLIAFALVIVAVAVVIMRFLLRTALAEDITIIGVLRACGHTTGGIIASLAATFALVTVVGSAVGVALSYVALPTVARVLTAQSGVTWQVIFAPVTMLGIVGALTGVVGLLAAASGAALRRLPTAVALRGGGAPHTYRSSQLPLATTRLPLAPALGVKAALQQWRQSLVLVLTIAMVTFAAVFSLGMTSSLLGSPDATIRLLVGELEDVDVTVHAGVDAHQLATRLASVPGVTTAFPTSAAGVSVRGTNMIMLVTDDPSVWRDDPVYEGRLPRHDNEVVLAAPVASRLGLRIGDTWQGDVGSGEVPFLVTGLASGARGMGQFGVLTGAGYLRLDAGFHYETVALYVTGDRDAVITDIKSRFGDDVTTVTDVRASVLVELSSYLSAVPILGATVAGFTVVVVLLGVGLVVATMVVRSRRQFGVQKALGFTHREIARQVRWAAVPSVALGALVGAVVGALTLAPLIRALLSGIGIMKVNVVPELAQVVGVSVAVISLAWLVTWFVARRLRGISAYALVTE
ncbi:MAG TPA: hypothetical protein DEG88_05545 [Propionibacteriaceae bacterium]|nr:hypothetical protein [Propionibacteriaceae bacterium]HBY22759.1 hypothetical protein [Propionibacteriaceae bacterium]